MGNPKVFEFAKEYGIETLALMDKIREWKLPVKSHMAELEPEILETLKSKLREEKEAKTKKKKKKVTKKKKTTAKKTAAKKTTKKKVVKRKVVRKSGDVDEISQTAKGTVIRRKAGAAKEAEESGSKAAIISRPEMSSDTAEESQVAEAVQSPTPEVASSTQSESDVMATSVEIPPQETGGDAKVADSAAKKDATETPVSKPKRKNIVGRMDLSRVSGPRQGGAKSQQPSVKPNRSGAGRNLRAGFVAAPMPVDLPPAEEKVNRKRIDKPAPAKKGPKSPAPEKAQETHFVASEMRKREIVFQPRKKKGVLNREARKTQVTKPKASKRVVKIYQTIKVGDLAQELGIKMGQMTKVLMTNGIMARPNTELDFDTASLVTSEFDYEAVNVHRSADELIDAAAYGDLEAEATLRPPIVTVMGHVDHGKTTLLDAIRNTDVAAGEAGGITQHIGAYQVRLEDGHVVTFVDTPGHEAFTAMRARGAQVTDIAVIVVAADDGVMPQTIEAVNHAKAAGVQILVAVNKVDRPNANIDRVKQQLAEHELLPEDWGGQTIFCEVSAIKKQGVKELVEQLHLLAEIAELRAVTNRSAKGIVVESQVEKGRGNVATFLVQEGTLKVGDAVVVGKVAGKIRRILDDHGKTIKEAGPSMPVQILGLPETPAAGDRFDVCSEETQAQEIADFRREQAEKEDASSQSISMENIFAKLKKDQVKELPVILKADVAGSVEAIRGMFDKIATDEVKARLIHAAVGGITESDILLARTSGAIVIGFNARPDAGALNASKEQGVEIKTYNIVYEMADDIKKAMSGLLDPESVENVDGQAEVRETFSVPKVGVIAGCLVTTGKVTRNSQGRVIRDGRVVYDGRISSLKRFKDDAKEVSSGYECGIGIENFNDLKAGDVIEAYTIEKIAREL